MNKRLACAAVVSLVLAAAFLRPRHRTLCEGFLPPNDMKIPVGDFRAKGIQEEMFNSVLDRVQAVYGPIVAQHGGELVINRKWDDPTVNANAQRYGSRWIINMYGGLARHPAVTPEGFATVACHELGHHLGGFPKIWGLFGSWASNEGEADYFATLKCLRLVLPDQAPADLDPIAREGCAGVFPEGPGRDHCGLGTMASFSTTALLADISHAPRPSLATPDPAVVEKTNNDHPAPQCRLDTLFAGALCARQVGEELSNGDPGPGACTSPAFNVGLRPLCWYKPPVPSPPASAFAARPVADVRTIEARLEGLRRALSGGGI